MQAVEWVKLLMRAMVHMQGLVRLETWLGHVGRKMQVG